MVALRTATRKLTGTGTGTRRPGRTGRRRRPGWSWFWLAFAAVYLLVPLYSTLQFSLQTGAHRYGLSWYGYILHQPQFRQSFALSLRLALETVLISLVLMIPTVYLVHAWLPKLRPLMEFICTLPFVVPPIALAVGMIGLFQARALADIQHADPLVRLRHPGAAVYLPLARRRDAVGRHQNAQRRGPERRGLLAPDAMERHPAEPAQRHPVVGVPDHRDRARRVHDRAACCSSAPSRSTSQQIGTSQAYVAAAALAILSFCPHVARDARASSSSAAGSPPYRSAVGMTSVGETWPACDIQQLRRQFGRRGRRGLGST